MKALTKDRNRTIRKSYKRFLSIVLMAMLGTGVFCGIRASGSNMLYQVKSYYDAQDIYDIKTSSTLGLTEEDIEKIEELETVENAYGVYELDAYFEIAGTQHVGRVTGIVTGKNEPEIIQGNLPTASDECVVDSDVMKDFSLQIGDKIELKEGDDEEENVLKNTQLTIVGEAKSPLVLNTEKGSSSLGIRQSRV